MLITIVGISAQKAHRFKRMWAPSIVVATLQILCYISINVNDNDMKGDYMATKSLRLDAVAVLILCFLAYMSFDDTSFAQPSDFSTDFEFLFNKCDYPRPGKQRSVRLWIKNNSTSRGLYCKGDLTVKTHVAIGKSVTFPVYCYISPQYEKNCGEYSINDDTGCYDASDAKLRNFFCELSKK